MHVKVTKGPEEKCDTRCLKDVTKILGKPALTLWVCRGVKGGSRVRSDN